MPERVKREFLVERHAFTSFVLYEVTREDLEQLEKETLTVGEDFSFALFALAVAISFTVTLATVDIPHGKTNDVFWIVMLLGWLAGAFFGVRWYRARGQFASVIQKIKDRGGPLGEEGREVEVVTSVIATETTTKEG